MLTRREELARRLDALEDELAYSPWLSEAGKKTIRDEAVGLRILIRTVGVEGQDSHRPRLKCGIAK